MTVVLLLLCLGADVGQTCLRPLGVGILAELGIVVAAVAGHFLAEPIRADERFIGSTELNFSHDEAFVLAVELVDLERVAVGHGDEPADFVDGARFAQTHEGERLVDLQAGGYCLIQAEGAFRFGTDSVLLADFAAPRKYEHIADLGCGDGAIAFLIAAHEPSATLDAVEIEAAAADRARRSVIFNGLEERMRVWNKDMRIAYESLGREKCALVVCNPPYGAKGAGFASASAAQRIARQEEDLTPAEVCAAADRLLKYGGRFCVIFPASRAFEMMAAMDACRLAPKRVRTVHATPGRAPKLILMDEPFVGLDPKAAYILKEMMRDHCNAGGAIFFSTHVLDVAEKLCDKVAIIKNGRLIKSGTMEEVKGDESLEEVFLELADNEAQ